MEDNGKLALDYFYNRIKSKIKQIVKEEIKVTENDAKVLTGGLGPEAELEFFNNLLNHKYKAFRSPTGHHNLPKLFTKNELQIKEFDTPSIIENRIEVYLSPYEERKSDFIVPIAKYYSNLGYIEYLKARKKVLETLISDKASKPAKGMKSRSTMVWVTGRGTLKKLHASLINEEFIGEIDFEVFVRHFEGRTQSEFINFLPQKALVFYLLEKLKNHINASFYNSRNETPSASVIAKHFVFQGKELKDFYSVKSKGLNPVKSIFTKKIDLIINSLSY